MDTRSQARILLAEDDPNVASALVAALQLLIAPEPTVICCASAEAAIELLILQPFDLLIADYCLPVMTGLELLITGRHHRPQMRAMLITGYAASEVEATARHHAIPFLSKPFSVHSLIPTVRQLLFFLPVKRDI